MLHIDLVEMVVRDLVVQLFLQVERGVISVLR